MSDALPATDASAEALMGEIVDEFLDRLGRGEQPDIEEYARRNPRLAAVVRRMLPALQVLHSSAVEHPQSAERPAPEIKPEGPLGDFRIVREIGRGGMGVVYESVQISLGRRVALKVLPFAAALDAKQLQRFQNEAQAAAQLHHQNIVPVYAVGCERGVHYYAMQFIDGQTLATLIQQLRRPAELEPQDEDACEGSGSEAADTFRQPAAALSTAQSTMDPAYFRTVARLAVQAAEALEHAHQLAVIHRDIKPANLLVDVRGNLWITDFGLAHCQSQAGLTMTGDVVGTLRYMSPEQALGKRVLLDHRADIYSLGATLYELLTLQPAFRSSDRQELLQQIAAEEPKPLRRINKAVPAELETIVLKTIAKTPEERYATAQELADDLERFLKDEPIRARRPTLMQRSRKWTRRHRPVVWSAAAALLVTVAVMAGSVGWVVRDHAAWQAQMAADLQTALDEAQQCQKEGKWPQAQAAAQRAEALLRDGAAEPDMVERVQSLLRELAEEEADGRLVARLETIRLLQADVKDDRFALESALPRYQQAFREYGWQVGAMPAEEAAAMLRRRPSAIRGTLLAALDHWLILARNDKAPEANWLKQVLSAADSDAWRQAVRAARVRGDRQALNQLAREVDVTAQPPEALFVLEVGLRQRGATEIAVALLRRAQAAYPGDFWINHDLGMALRRDCRPPQYEEAIRFLTAAVALRPESPGARLNLGNALLDKGRLDEAAAAFRQAIRLKPDYAMAHRNLANVLIEKGQLDEALAACRRAIDLKPDDADAHGILGFALWKLGRLDEAAAAFRQAIELKPDDALTHHNLGNVLIEKGHVNEALLACRRAIDLKPDYAEAHCNLGAVLAHKGRLDEAAAAYRRAIDLKPNYAVAHHNLGGILWKHGQLDEAIAAYRRAIELKPDLAVAHYNLGLVLGQKGRLDEAIAACRRAIERKPDYAEAHRDLGYFLWKQGRFDEAGTAFRKAIELKPDFANAHYNLGNVLIEKGHVSEALAAWRRAIELNPELAEAHCNLGVALQRQGEFTPALAALKRGHELGSRRPDWPYPSARWLRECKRLVELDERLPAILRGETQPADAAERNEYAHLCYCKKLYAASARLRAEAFAADPKLADDLNAGSRYDAACAAALAAAGPLDDKERVCWRKQALEWLRADLAANAKLLESGQLKDRERVRQRLRQWRRDPDLAGVRDPAALAVLPTSEQQACKQLRAEVEALFNKASDTP
jgi:tetratricopeptide (TPR) repeat protein